MTRDELEQFELFSPHCFRHSFATRCFEAGIKSKTVQGYLGHATLQMTMDLYTHVLKEHSMEEMEKLEKVLDDTLDVSEDVVNQKYEQFISKNQVKRLFILTKLRDKSRSNQNWSQFWSQNGKFEAKKLLKA